MQDGMPSATARAVALVRATMDRPVTPDGDGRVEATLVAEFPTMRRSPLAPRLGTRTRWFDRVTLDAIDGGTTQIVIVAAGYDCRALRFRSPGVRFVELDHPATQSDKLARVRAAGATVDDIGFAAADFTVDDVGAALAGAGHAPERPTLFLCEGLLIYLDEAVIGRLLGALRAVAHPESRLAVSMSRPPTLGFQARVARAGEPARSSFTPDTARELLNRCGWDGDTSTALVLAAPIPMA